MEVPLTIAPEKSVDTSAIHFEPGIHPLTNNEITAVYANFTQGNLDAHGWDTEVSERIASYAYTAPALLLTIDGLEPVPHTPDRLFTPLQEAGIIWTHLPARPNKLNRSGAVYVVKGDNLYEHIPQTVLPHGAETSSLYNQMDAQETTAATNANEITGAAIGGETAGVGALSLALWGASKLLFPSVPQERMSRRRFLGNTIKALTATAITGSLLRYDMPNIVAQSPNEPTKDFLQMVDNVVRPRIARPIFQDGRTAMLLAKAEDAQIALAGETPQPTNVVIMGDGHDDMVKTFLQDKKQRDKAIAAFAQEVLALAKQVYGSFYHVSPDHISPQATQFLLNYISQVDIVKVTDPGGSSFQPSVAQSIDKQVTLYKSFTSPQVAEAIKSLQSQQ